MNADEMRRRLRVHARPGSVPLLQRFFKTGPGQYAEGDVFIGVTVPMIRAVCRQCPGASLAQIRTLLRSRVHEERLLALLLLIEHFRDYAKAGDVAGQKRIYDFYLAHTSRINNWDLVDASASAVVGGWLAGRSKAPLTRLARSSSIWERRIAIVATFDSLRRGEVGETLRIAQILLDDRHDLIHKAVGWLLREVGKRDGPALRKFLRPRHATMPRTMVRYAIERFPPEERHRYLTGRRSVAATALGVVASGSRRSTESRH